MSTVAVVGAGFCGTMVATHLLRADQRAIDRIVLVERNGRDIGGVAYGTSSTSHTLNVPAGRMSAFDDDPDDFLRFVRAVDPALTGGAFVPRRLYGEYLGRTLDDARLASSVRLIRVAGEAVAAVEHEAGVTLELRDGRVLGAQQAVLAVGNYPPSDPPATEDGLYRSIRYARDPWAPDALEAERDEPVLLLGTGLTMCDIALALRDADHHGEIVAISRRGLLPQPHRVSPKPPPHLDPPVEHGRLGTERARAAPWTARRGEPWSGGRDRLARGRHVDPARHPGTLAAAGRRRATPLPPSSPPVLGDASPPLVAGDRVRGRGDGRDGRLRLLTGRVTGYEEAADRRDGDATRAATAAGGSRSAR